MITINLLPEELRAKESSLAQFKIDFKGNARLFKNVAISAVAVLIVTHIVLFFIGARSSSLSGGLERKYSRLLPEKKEYESLKVEADIANGKAKAIDGLLANRFSWAGKLNELSDCVPQGIWLTDLSYDEKTSQIAVQVPVSSMRSGVKKEITKTETKEAVLRYLNISGYATSMGEQGTALVGKFIAQMKESAAFFADFSEIKLESIKSEKVLEQEAMSFKITCQFKN